MRLRRCCYYVSGDVYGVLLTHHLHLVARLCISLNSVNTCEFVLVSVHIPWFYYGICEAQW